MKEVIDGMQFLIRKMSEYYGESYSGLLAIDNVGNDNGLLEKPNNRQQKFMQCGGSV
jgi:hypothetical protein